MIGLTLNLMLPHNLGDGGGGEVFLYTKQEEWGGSGTGSFRIVPVSWVNRGYIAGDRANPKPDAAHNLGDGGGGEVFLYTQPGVR